MNGGIPVSSNDAVLRKKTEGEVLSAGGCLSKTVLYQFAQKAVSLHLKCMDAEDYQALIPLGIRTFM